MGAMSASGQKQTYAVQIGMSAFFPKAEFACAIGRAAGYSITSSPRAGNVGDIES
jgi:hypothetical protein